jgi:hypothetical protein
VKTITITAWKRPQYLSQVLKALAKNDLHGYKLFIAIEPPVEENPVVMAVASGACHFIDTEVIVNPIRYGVRENPYRILKRVFEEEGSEANIYLEEDTVLSPDTTKVANWYFDEVDKERLMSLHLFTYGSDPDRPLDWYQGKDGFSALGFCLTKDQWERWYGPHWLDHDLSKKHFPKSFGWDFAMHACLREFDLEVLLPACGRTNHIGREGGVHATPAFHDQHFPQIKICDDPAPGEYRIVPRP